MTQFTKKEWIAKLVAAAKAVKNANPWALALVSYDDLRMQHEGKLTVSGQQWYAEHTNDPMGMLDKLTVSDELDLQKFVKNTFDSIVERGGADFWVIPSETLADVLKYLMSHPRFQGNLLDRDDEDPWNMPDINFESLCAAAENQFLSNQPINVVFEYKDADTGLVIHRVTLNEKDFWYFVDAQQMMIADRKW